MAEYWVKTSPESEAEGPLSAIEVKRRAVAEEISRDALISTDGATWHPAGRVKGLFPSAAPLAGAPVDPLFEQPVPAATAQQQPAAAAGRARGSRPRHGGLPPAYPGTAPMFRPATTPPRPVAESPPPPPSRVEASSPSREEVGNGDGVAAAPLSAPAAPLSAPAASARATPPPLPTPAAPRAPLPQALPYATPGGRGGGYNVPVRPRKTRGFSIVTALLVPAAAAHAYGWCDYLSKWRMSDLGWFSMVGGDLAWLILGILSVSWWLNWVRGVHGDIRALGGGQQAVGRTSAVTMSLIPVFSAFWSVYMPAKLTAAVNAKLDESGLPLIGRGTVVFCQVASVLASLVALAAFAAFLRGFGSAAWLVWLFGLTPPLYAVTMRTIQSGLNRLVAQQYAT
jgi:hypothetical protein